MVTMATGKTSRVFTSFLDVALFCVGVCKVPYSSNLRLAYK